MNKVKLNFWLDVVIGLAFLAAAITGLAFLVMGSGGYQGGRNANYALSFLGIERAVWSDLHTLGSLIMMAGVGMHMVLHWNWLVCVARRMAPSLPKRVKEQACEVTV